MRTPRPHRTRPSLLRDAAVFLAVFACAVVGSLLPARALEIEFAGRTVKRSILAFYDSRHEAAASQTRVHKLAEMPLNHLGYTVTFRDVNAPLPDVATLSEHRAILTWFIEPLASPESYVAWLEKAVQTGIKYVMIGEIAPREPDELLPTINRILARLGLRHTGGFNDLTFRTKVTTLDATMIGFESKLDKVLPGYPILSVIPGQVRVHLALENPASTGPMQSAVIATNDAGGFAAQNFTVVHEPNTDRIGWLLNPFNFFKLALGDERMPIPDVTTASGRRIYFSHIDGDGWNNISEVEGYRESQTLSAEVIRREAIAAFPDLPVSVGLIAGDVQPLLGGNPAGARIARALFALPQVEVASHTHTHPYHWEYFSRYDRSNEERLVAAYRPPEQPTRERISQTLLRTAGKTYINSRYDPFVAGSDELPRTYLRQPFNLELEVTGALRFSEQFAPPGRKAKLYQWSGDTTPFESAIRATREAGVRNINGGDTRLDREYPSVAYVPAIARSIGKERQIYAVNSNENTYTNEWTGPFGGQMMLEHTLRNTDSPRRLKGFNLYYHMYSGEKQASLAAIKYYLDMARTGVFTPMFASDYAAIADDFFSTEIQQVDHMSWVVLKRGALQTVRFDNANELTINIGASPGVIGFHRHDDHLFVSLDPAVERAVVTIQPIQAQTAAVRASDMPLSLVHSRWRFSGLRRSPGCGGTVTAQGFGPGEMQWRVGSERSIQAVAMRQGEVIGSTRAKADAEGQVSIEFPPLAMEPVEIRVLCND